jgi:uncharacterized protein (DUF2141 family)
MYRSIIAALVLAASVQTADAQTANGTVAIQLTGLRPQGQVMAQIFSNEEGYRGGRAVGAMMAAVSGATAEISFPDLAPGQYAFRLFHDVNGDGEMNTNPFGMPVEPYAFSNNAVGNMGPARWSAARFAVSGETTQTISIR